jgi:hypothetical protein
MRDDQQNDPYAPPSARVDDAAQDKQWHLGFRVLRALRWAFLIWLTSTLVIGILGGLAGRQFGEMHLKSFSDAAEVWAWFAAFMISPIFAAILFPIGLFRRIRAADLARLASQRDQGDGRDLMRAEQIAARHLLAPTYIVDYARMKKITLDDVHREVRRGLLRTYWHDGICFIDADTTKGEPIPPD